MRAVRLLRKGTPHTDVVAIFLYTTGQVLHDYTLLSWNLSPSTKRILPGKVLLERNNLTEALHAVVSCVHH